jgi:hypothetical protein
LTLPTPQRNVYAHQQIEARLTLFAAILSITALLYFYAHDELVLYGDAVAHLNIARRVVDNRHPLQSYGQLGTVWLPLQHIAMLPFVWVDTLWRSGIAGAVPGMVAYVLGTLGIFRLVRARVGLPSAYIAAAIYALNPNLLYMQTAAMNEPIMLAFFVWSLVYLDEFLRATAGNAALTPATLKPRQALEYCGICMAGGALTRYDGWFSAAFIGVILTVAFLSCRSREGNPLLRRSVTKSFAEVLLLNALVPVYWLIYTWAISGYALDFLNGPYSAKAIAARSAAQGAPPYPGQHDILAAAQYFLKSAQLNVAMPLAGRALLILALLGTAIAIWKFRRFGVVLLLWLPLAFYALSIAYGSVPIYIPVWWPFSYYNVRYGLELLPVFAVFPVLLTSFVTERLYSGVSRACPYCALITLVAISYAFAFAAAPITLREARTNSRDRIALEDGLAGGLAHLPRSSTLLMYEAEHAGAIRLAQIPLKNIVSESEHPEWEWALLDPAHHSDFIVACQGDPVWTALRHRESEVQELFKISAPGEAPCAIYRSH